MDFLTFRTCAPGFPRIYFRMASSQPCPLPQDLVLHLQEQPEAEVSELLAAVDLEHRQGRDVRRRCGGKQRKKYASLVMMVFWMRAMNTLRTT